VRRAAFLTALLLCVDFHDELAAGIPFVGAPDIRAEFGVSYALAAGWVLAAIQAASIMLEPPLFLLADRWPRKALVAGGLALLGATCGLASLAPTYGLFLVAIAAFGPLSGCGVGLSQATLMDANPDNRERLMMRWVVLGSLGDLATPVLFSALALLGLAWRGAFSVAGALFLAHAWLLWRQTFPERPAPKESDPVKPSLLASLREALGSRALVTWCIAATLCGLLDETLVAFGALHLTDGLGASVHARDAALGALLGGNVVGAVATERLLAHVAPVRLLLGLSAASAIALVAWIAAPSLGLGIPALAAVGVCSAGHYAIAKAQAYRAWPDRSGAVNAVRTLFLPFDVLAPIGLGLVADRFGLRAALALLLAQPLGLLLIGLAWLRGLNALRSRGEEPTPGGPS
jgi:FSR family fosmidomycin resistance protein-like MFS transporter